MSMKKKFLALALAGMVAMPVVANATAGNYKTIGGTLTQTPTSDLIVNGSIDRADGTAAAGRIQVELPTAMSFTVDKNGVFNGPSNFEIRNTGSEAVKVDILNFSESLPTSGIDIVGKSTLNDPTTSGREKVSLVLRNGTKEVDLYSAKGNTKQELCTKIDGGQMATIDVIGKAGTSTQSTIQDVKTNGANEDFTIKFQISHTS